MQNCAALLLSVAGVQDATPPPQPDFEMPAACVASSAAIDAIPTKYADEQKALERDGQELGDRAKMHHANVVVVFKERDLSFSVPSVTMRPVKFSINVPTTTMALRKVRFKVPEVTMREVTIGWRPVCRRLSCHMQAIKTKVPEWRMVNHDMSTKVPVVTMNRLNFAASIPEFKMKPVGWAMKVPQFTLTSPIPQQDPDIEHGSQDLQRRGEALGARIQGEVVAATSDLNSCIANDLTTKRAAAALQFEVGIAQINATIDTLRSGGADPAATAGDDGVVNYIKLRDDLIAERDKTLSQIDAAIATLTPDTMAPAAAQPVA